MPGCVRAGWCTAAVRQSQLEAMHDGDEESPFLIGALNQL